MWFQYSLSFCVYTCHVTFTAVLLIDKPNSPLYDSPSYFYIYIKDMI